jgi:general secretion pathway protein G
LLRADRERAHRAARTPGDHWHHGDRPRVPAGSGFTLLELLVVMVIIGLLAAYVGPRYFSQIGKSEIKVTKAQIDALEKALDAYRLDVGRYPTTEQGLAALEIRPNNETKWQGPYLKKAVPPDPWGKPYQYRAPGEKGEFDLFSFGKDGQAGGEGENADITNWN